jgi:predicted metal-dependent phosphoesterase TrpH
VKVELHCHTSRHSACSLFTPEELLTVMVATGYDAVYFTEHATVWAEDDIADLQAKFPTIRIFPGIELVTPTNPYEHLLVLGTSDPEYAVLADHAEWGKVLTKARTEGHLTVLAHPCRFDGGHEMISRNLLPDALELWTCNQSQQVMIDNTRALNATLSLPLVHAGDTHGPDMIDRFWIETHRPLDRADDIRDIILTGDYDCRGA